MRSASPDSVIERLETDLLVEAVTRVYGVDFQRYSPCALEAWTQRIVESAGAATVAALIERILHDPAFGAQALGNLRDCDIELCAAPLFWQQLSAQVLPWLRTYPFIDIWVAQCGSGADIYSLAIWLDEADLLDRAHIYATDSDAVLLDRAARGLIPQAALPLAEHNYRRAGGKKNLRDYFETDGAHIRLHDRLRQNIVWSQFNLEQGESFNEFNFIDCRAAHQGMNAIAWRRAFKLFDDSLNVSGLLALNAAENSFGLRRNHCYKEWRAGLYQRIR